MIEKQIRLNATEDVKEFVNIVMRFDFDVDLVSGRYVIDAKSIMGIFSTDLSKPVNVRIHAQGAEAEKALQVVQKYAEE
mgnify:CR=1 FL=1